MLLPHTRQDPLCRAALGQEQLAEIPDLDAVVITAGGHLFIAGATVTARQDSWNSSSSSSGSSSSSSDGGRQWGSGGQWW